MRLNSPMNGLIKAKGHILIHLALFVASFFVYLDDASLKTPVTGQVPVSQTADDEQ